MSRHRLYQNYDFQSELDDNDGILQSEEEEEEDELSPEDRIQMEESTVEVKRALGVRSDEVTIKQIQDALWHYYYDVDKSVAYLINKFIEPAPKPMPKTKTAQKPNPSSDGTHTSACPLFIDVVEPLGVSEAVFNNREHVVRPPSTLDLFADMPWQNIPEHRRTIFVKPPRLRGGLLGGSPVAAKPSKLAALAAARKKKAEDAALVMLPKKDEKRTADEASKPNKHDHSFPTYETSSQSEKDRENPELDRQAEARSVQLPYDSKSCGRSAISAPATSQVDGASSSEPTVCMAKPSAFAQVLCYKTAPETPQPGRAYRPPWMAFTTPEALHEAFDKPSPDDVVLAAQSQGSRFSGESRG